MQWTIVKFPRGTSPQDTALLKNEAAYYEVARAYNLKVGRALSYEDGVLFIPRFEREALAEEGGVLRYTLQHRSLSVEPI